MPFASVFGSFAGGPFHGLAFDGLTFDLGVVTDAGISLGGVDIHARVRKQGLTIHDILNDAPNTCSLVVEGTAPVVGQSLRITINDGRLLFAGSVQSVDQSYEVNPQYPAWAVTAIDDTARANQRRPFGTWVETSATTIAQSITTTFAPGFSTAGIEAGLPLVSIVLDGADTFIAALTRLASLIGGYAKVEDNTIYLFLDDTAAPPDPIDADHCFMFDPPISATIDSSQLRTRVYGKGYGENITADLLAGETLIPIENGAQFPPAGLAIAGTKADTAQSERLAYTGRELAAGGTLVGPGAAPTTAPGVSLAAGTGVESGLHEYAFVYVTAAGRSLPSPRAAITVGALAPPSTAMTASAPYPGPGNLATPGVHRYYAQFRTATGTTPAGPVSNAVTTVAGVAPPASGPAVFAGGTSRPGGGLDPAAWYSWGFTFWDGGVRETVLSPIVTDHLNYNAGAIVDGGLPSPPSGFQICWYRTEGGASAPGPTYKRLPFGQPLGQFSELAAGYLIDTAADGALGAAAPTTDRSALGSITLTAIPVSSSSLVTHVDLYREFNNAGAATARLLTSQVNGTTSIVDGLPNESLGALMPSTNTTSANRVNVTWPAGPAAVTSIELFRTPIGSSQLKKFANPAGNAAGSVIDSTPDASLTTNAPTGDTSGLTQPSGQVNPGAAALPVASTTPFRAAGGWVALAGDQVVRYTGITGSTLSGIPAAGAGAITTTVIYGAPAIPAPMLTGVTGITGPILKGAAIHIWVQRDDLPAQAAQAARAGGDGVVEHLLVDTRRGLDSLVARCDADLALFARPIVTVAYSTRDLKTKSGKTVTINLTSPAISETLTIQDVTITEIDQVPGVPPRYTVTASSVRFSLEDTLRRLIAGGQIVGGSS